MRKLKRAVIKEEFIAITEDYFAAVILNQFVFWSQRVKDFDKFIDEENKREPGDYENLKSYGWIYKSAKELQKEIMFGKEHTLRKRIKSLINLNILEERINPNHKWDKTFQYRLNLKVLNQLLTEKGYFLEGYKKNISTCPEQPSDMPSTANQDDSEGTAIPKIPIKKEKKEIYKEKKKKEIPEEISNLFVFWNEQKMIIHRDIVSHISTIKSALKKYSIDELKGAIENLSTAIKSDQYWWSHKYTLNKFLTRKGVIDQFLTENDPLSSLLDAEESKKQRELDKKVEEACN